ncbi:VOC family protein [Flavobacteriales bacterium]|nr:VOC family protein [Flavobacteriales bacterium]
MNFRFARHTDNLEPIIKFYRDLLGLEVIGEFNNHDKYDGVFIGKVGLNWHLEFTTSEESPKHQTDKDDLLVFYLESEEEYISVKQKFDDNGLSSVQSKNPYWNNNGSTYLDPDGFRIVITIMKK